jgi:hypothetical protein
MTRNGKIARLPQAVRDELNQRLQDGRKGVELIQRMMKEALGIE